MKRWVPVSLFTWVALLPMTAAAASEEHGELTLRSVISNPELWGAVINFGLLCYLIMLAIKKQVNPSFAERRAQVEAGIKEAQLIKEEAEAKHAEYQSRLDKLDSEIGQIRADMVKAGQAERDRIVTEAEEKAARMRKDTRFVIEQQMKQLRKDLTKEAVASAIDTAEKILTEQTADNDQKRLADTYLTELVGAASERQRQS